MTNEFTLDDFLDEFAPAEKTVHICSRGDLVADLEVLAEELKQARAEDERENRDPLAPQIAGRIVDLEEEARRYERPFRFASLSLDTYSNLVAQHPPTAEQQTRARKQEIVMEWNPDTFLPALVAASCVAPKMSKDGVARLSKMIGPGQWADLWRTALRVNTGSVSVPNCVAAYAILGVLPPRSTTARLEESLDQSS